MRRYETIVTPEAYDDIVEIYNYISVELGNPFAATRLVSRISAKINSLSYFPERSRLRDNIFMVKVGHYRIIYQVTEKTVIIAAITYTGRDSLRWFLD